MARIYPALCIRAMNMMLKDRIMDAPTPAYYDHPPRLSPHPFIGLGKFVAGKRH